ncbi:hypothetical protein D3C75_1111690 [compost metagenome]
MKLRIDKKKRQVIIDDYFRIGGAIIPAMHCKNCESVMIYYDRYDAEFCPDCNAWLSAPCGDSTCFYCNTRPTNPLEIKNL